MLQNDSTNFIVFQDENIIIDDLRTVDGVYVISAHFKEIPNDVFCTKC